MEKTIVNQMKTVLIISESYLPCKMFQSGTKRIESYARYLPEFGWRCIFLVPACHCSYDIHDGYDEIKAQVNKFPDSEILDQIKTKINNGSNILIIKIPCAPIWVYRVWIYLARLTNFSYKNKDEEFELFHYVFPYPDLHSKIHKNFIICKLAIPIRKLFSGILRFPHELDRVGWIRKGFWFGKRMCDEMSVNAIIASSHINLIIGSVISRTANVPWIADIRDSIFRGWTSKIEKMIRVLRFKKYISSASAIIHVTPQEAERDKRWFKKESFIIENGFFEEDIQQARVDTNQDNKSCFIIRFLGYIYPQQNLDIFFKGFQKFINLEMPMKGEISFEYYGNSWYEIENTIINFGIQDFCSVNEAVSTYEALKLTVSSTILVLPTNNVGQSGIPGAKFYEYLGAKRPILAAGGKDEYVEGILKKTKAGVLCNSPEEVASVLKEWFKKWKLDGKLDIQLNEKEIKKFSRRNGIKKLANILDAVSEGKKITPNEI
ncbi:MAG: hypothetical protein ACUVWN_16160 [bacterium]